MLYVLIVTGSVIGKEAPTVFWNVCLLFIAYKCNGKVGWGTLSLVNEISLGLINNHLPPPEEALQYLHHKRANKTQLL